jgi:hypothetical protein
MSQDNFILELRPFWDERTDHALTKEVDQPVRLSRSGVAHFSNSVTRRSGE